MKPDNQSSTELGQTAPQAKPTHKLPIFIGVGVVLGCLGMLCVIGLASAGLLSSIWMRANDVSHETESALVMRASATSAPAPSATISPTLVPIFTVTPIKAPAVPTVTATPTVTRTNFVSLTAETTARQARIFTKLWEIVNTNYIYPDFNGLDWNALREKTLDQINTGMDDEEFYSLMRDTIERLNDHHSSFLSPQEARDEEQDYEGTGNYSGIGIITDINLDKGYAYVLQVLPGSPAERAGIHTHEHILSINGKPTVISTEETNMPLLRGPAGTYVTVTVGGMIGKPRSLVIKRAKLSTTTPVEHRTIMSGTKRIGYLLIPTLFEDTVGDEVRSALGDLVKKGSLDGLIIDMRINGGGAYPVLMRCLGFFTTGTVGSLTNRAGIQKTLVARSEKVGNSQTVPITILAGHATVSYAEVFAGILRGIGRAKLIGQKTAGNIETLHAHDFEDGSMAWIAEETFRLLDGSNWESQGLTPDINVDKAWDEISDENDPVITAALKAF